MTRENFKSWLATLALYTAIFVTALAFFVMNGIDGGSLALKLESLVQQNSKIALKIGNTELSLPATLTLLNVTVDDNKGTKLKFDNLSLRPLLIPLLTGNVTLRVVTRTTNGELVIDLLTDSFGTKLRGIKIKANDVAIQEIVLSAGGSPLPINGELSGDGDLQFPAGSIALPELSGDVTVSLNNIQLNADVLGKALFKNLSPKKASCKITIQKRRLTTNQCEVLTNAGKFDLRLSSQLLNNVLVSQLRGTLIVRPTEGPLKRFLGIYPNRRRPDGGYHFPLKGTLASPGIDL